MKLFESAKFSRMAPILFSPTETFWFCQIFKVGTSSKLAVGSSWHSHWQLPPPAWLPPIAATLLAFCRDSVLLRAVFLWHIVQYFCVTMCCISALLRAVFLFYVVQYFCVASCRISELLRAVFCSIGSSVHYVGAHQLWPALSLCTMWSWQLLKLADVDMLSFIYNQFKMFLRLCVGLKVCFGCRILMKREKAWRDQD